VLSADPDIVVVGEAADGKAAIAQCISLRPSVVTMDMVLPIMSGLGATEYIMAHCPTPILVVSSSTNRGELFKTFEALAAGAVDVLEKPSGNEDDGHWEAAFVSTVKIVSRIRVITHPRARLAFLGRPVAESAGEVGTPADFHRRCSLIAIGASTGGPGAVVEILKALPTTFAIPILLVVHIGEPFGSAFADWLDGQTGRRVGCARDGETLKSAEGRVVLAPPGRHLVVRNGRIHLTSDPERHSCRPSVDALFESVARQFGAGAAACLLTGMGRDGAAGLLEIRRAGGLTIAQDEESCVVFGMPREAVLLGAAERILPLDRIGATLAALSSAFEVGPG
jgi:two-component system chemotaxis response regulator CheB